MKKTIIALLCIVFAVAACQKNTINPSNDPDQTGCSVQTTIAHEFLAGTASNPKKWNAVYTDSTGARLSVPGLISSTASNTVYFQPNDSLKEFSYTGNQIDSGTWSLSNCGKTVILNTNLSGKNLPFVLTELTPIYFKGYFYIPVGPGGSIVKTFFIGNLAQ